MKWDFFYDEDEGKPYEFIQDWSKDDKHRIISTISTVFLGIAVYVYLGIFHS